MRQRCEGQQLGFGAVAIAALLAAGAATAQVQVQMDPALERQADEAYRQILQQPNDLALWSKYARIQVEGGNYEGAIGALERLMLQPDYPPELPLEIAVLYYRLGSYGQAAALANQALADSRLPAAQRAFAETIARDALRRNQPTQLRGHAVVGIRSQSNPAYRTSASQVQSAGIVVPVAANQKPDSDRDINLGLRLQHTYDLEWQNSAAITSNFSAYVVDYHASSGSALQASPTHAYDLTALDLNTGFEFKPMPGTTPQLTLRPHLSLANITAQRHRYMDGKGLGLDISWRQDERTVLDVTVDTQHRDFETRVDFLNAADVSGRLASVRARLSRELRPGHVFTGEVAFRANATRLAMHDYDQQEARVTYAVSYASPVSPTAPGWTTSVSLAALQRDYDAPDPGVNANAARTDSEWRLSVNHAVPITSQWMALFSVEHARNRSNLPNFRYRNTSASASLMRSF